MCSTLTAVADNDTPSGGIKSLTTSGSVWDADVVNARSYIHHCIHLESELFILVIAEIDAAVQS